MQNSVTKAKTKAFDRKPEQLRQSRAHRLLYICALFDPWPSYDLPLSSSDIGVQMPPPEYSNVAFHGTKKTICQGAD